MTNLTPHQSDALNYKNHISLTANAGSGKTFVLSKRYLEIAINEKLSLRNIAAITFTDKAASELYKKIAKQIDEKLEETNDKFVIKKLENIRRQLVSANISTIHSFCIDILKEHPVEAGLDANFSPIDSQVSDDLIELSVEEVIKNALSSNEEIDKLKYLIRIFASKNIFAKEIISLINNRKNVLNIEKRIYSKDIDEIAGKFHFDFLDFANKLFLVDIDKIIKAIDAINKTVTDYKSDNKNAIEIDSLIANLKDENDVIIRLNLLLNIKQILLTGKGKVRTQGYLKKDYIENLLNEIALIENYFADFKYLDIPENSTEIEIELAKFGKELLHFFNKALKLYEDKKTENGYLDYEDILLHTQKILDIKNVRESLSEKYKYIMIDEYQDTNETQYNIFLPILENLKKGNLFVVGDEKQSIYMFRDAELEVFNRTKKNIEEISGINYLLSLPDSFRMAPELCLFTNYIFKNLFSKPNILFNEVEHTDLVCARSDELKGKIEILLAGAPIQKADNCNNNFSEANNKDKLKVDVNIDEAELIARRILNLIFKNELPEKLKWNDAAVLCRKRSAFNELESAFIKYKIPFTIVGGKGFYQRQTIFDIYNYFSFLLDSTNDTALIGILRSPFFTISDSEIFEIANNSGTSYWNKLKIAAKENQKLADTAAILNENLLLSKNLDLTSMLRKIIRDSDMLSVLSSRADGIQELANIKKLISLTIKFSGHGFNTLYDYVNYLKDSIDKSDDEAQAAITDESNSVKIMTLHQSKGLEFPAVFLYKCTETSNKAIVKTKSNYVNKDFGLLTKVPLSGDYFSQYHSAPIIGISNLITDKKNLAEIKRLFYVGITRAKNYLFLSASYKQNNSYNPDSFMGLLQKALNIDFEDSKIVLKHSLDYLKNENDNFYNETKELTVHIPVIKSIDDFPILSKDDINLETKENFNIDEIKDRKKDEIISATKVAVFKQCPLKYQLTYEFGFGQLMNQYKKWFRNKNQNDIEIEDYNFNSDEDNIAGEQAELQLSNKVKSYGDVKGRIIHKILQKELPFAEVEKFAESSIKNELNIIEYEEINAEELKNQIISDLKNYYSSKTYSFVHGFSNFMNEYEIYVKEDDYYLYGIIDKLIITNENIIIVDYKTDDIQLNEIDERSKAYLTQLRFYAYIVNRLFSSKSNFQLRLIFLKHPDAGVTEEISRNELQKFGKEIKTMVELVRNNDYSKNLTHCKKCLFALNHSNCIKK